MPWVKSSKLLKLGVKETYPHGNWMFHVCKFLICKQKETEPSDFENVPEIYLRTTEHELTITSSKEKSSRVFFYSLRPFWKILTFLQWLFFLHL